MTYPEEYRTEIYLVKFEKDIKYPELGEQSLRQAESISPQTLQYTFVGAFPSSVTSTPVSYGASDILRVNVSFSYMRYVRERKDIKLSSFRNCLNFPQISLFGALQDFLGI